MSTQFQKPDGLENLLMLTFGDQVQTESERMLTSFRDRKVNRVVAELATMTTAVALVAQTINKQAGTPDAAAEMHALWLNQMGAALTVGIESMRKDTAKLAPPPRQRDPGVEQLLDTLREIAGNSASMDSAKREVLTAVVAGEKCPGCDEVHDITEEARAEIQAELDTLKKNLH